ncbi:hypothetical protein HYH03_012636 [Edaphochlamys debaryana]|uniref:Uncharacterized protein n=1 Tax=Edaphochlamys debaryana TaxID=47281 RepID=A0A835XRD6_9CHLO|nr:hypothetical protein HYH03_012636 [Edaphochlamys debaryana]|eukprot:KAG2488838.1 hypothetical protein HYH03_012636 [Edaphochlamys debaryana]
MIPDRTVSYISVEAHSRLAQAEDDLTPKSLATSLAPATPDALPSAHPLRASMAPLPLNQPRTPLPAALTPLMRQGHPKRPRDPDSAEPLPASPHRSVPSQVVRPAQFPDGKYLGKPIPILTPAQYSTLQLNPARAASVLHAFKAAAAAAHVASAVAADAGAPAAKRLRSGRGAAVSTVAAVAPQRALA